MCSLSYNALCDNENAEWSKQNIFPTLGDTYFYELPRLLAEVLPIIMKEIYFKNSDPDSNRIQTKLPFLDNALILV